MPTPPVPAVRLGDPLRRRVLEELARCAALPPPIADEWTVRDAELVIAVVDGDDGPELGLASAAAEGRRFTLRQPLARLDEGDLVEAWETIFTTRGHPPLDACRLAQAATAEVVEAVAVVMERCATWRPEQRATLTAIAEAIRSAVAPQADDPGDGDGSLPAVHGNAVDDDTGEDEDDEAWDANDDDEAWDEDEDEDDDDDDDHDEEEAAAEALVSLPRPSAARPTPPPAVRRPTSPPRRRRTGRRVAQFALLLAMLGGGAGAIMAAGPAPNDRATARAEAQAPSRPGQAPAVTPDFVVAARNADGTPVRLDPCATYDYVVQPGSLDPDAAADDAGAAFAALERATGVAFRFTGYSTDTVPFPVPVDAPPRRPILVSFEDPATSPALRDGAIEHGLVDGRPLGGLTETGPVPVRPGLSVLAGGVLVVNEDLDSPLRRRVLLHELGHLAGLAHATDPGQIMHAQVPGDGPVAFREGDRAGLAAVGAAAGCVLTPEERARIFT